LGILIFALAVSALVGCGRMLVVLRRESRLGGDPTATIAALWGRLSGAIKRMGVLAAAVSLVAWGVSGVLAYSGTTRGLENVSSLSELVGATRVTPSPVGPEIYGYAGAVIGDSRAARVGGPPVADPTAVDSACERSADSLGAELGLIQPSR